MFGLGHRLPPGDVREGFTKASGPSWAAITSPDTTWWVRMAVSLALFSGSSSSSSIPAGSVANAASVAANTRPHEHPGVEVIYVLSGELGVTVEVTEHTLESGEAIYFAASVPHSYCRTGRRSCAALVVTVA